MKTLFFQWIFCTKKYFFVVKIAKNAFRRQKCTENPRRRADAAAQFTVFEYPHSFFSHSARSNACSGAERDGSAPTSAAALCVWRAISSGSVHPSASPMRSATHGASVPKRLRKRKQKTAVSRRFSNWRQWGSNLRPHGCEPCALTN